MADLTDEKVAKARADLADGKNTLCENPQYQYYKKYLKYKNKYLKLKNN